MKDLQTVPLRPPEDVMRLSRMGAAFPTRLSFLPTLMRVLRDDNVQVQRPIWDMDAEGLGHAVYTLTMGGYQYALVAVTTSIRDEERSDRVIAEAWDAAFVLYDGIPDAAERARIVRDAPRQEAARFTERDLVLSRANKSIRVFTHVVNALRNTVEFDRQLLQSTGYLMRTTAVYGNGKFGIADRARIAMRPGLSGPFMAEMLTVWLIRGFTHDLVAHVGGRPLPRSMRRGIGVGNATGLGMAPFLVSHPHLLHAWHLARETALMRVRSIAELGDDRRLLMCALADKAASHLRQWNVADPIAQERIEKLRSEWQTLQAQVRAGALLEPYPIDRLIHQSRRMSLDFQEMLVSFAIEPFGDLVDDLVDRMATDVDAAIDLTMSVAELRAALARDWSWAVSLDFDMPDQSARFWYVSEDKLEPRLGDRRQQASGAFESPLDIARQIKALADDLKDARCSLAEFLRVCPEHRSAVRRVQTLIDAPYAEIRDNLIAETCRPIDMLRSKLAFFGATRFDPKSDLWTRITLAQGAPLFDELERADDMWCPVFEAS
ncbi:hypothetical protein [Thalassococcus sp. S3]|uniref:hypothetical protein n=1 Tax=Thalassococcus sp. S3 TaxID=2017482 RepID=UPI00102486BD|nr:hypothetical protein [Thalassococcus sp. S3]QBF33002.1 hypothetical protein CFI11_17500 [Thalassococcus sp. S3]